MPMLTLACAVLQDNLYRLGLLTHLQSDAVPLKVPHPSDLVHLSQT